MTAQTGQSPVLTVMRSRATDRIGAVLAVAQTINASGTAQPEPTSAEAAAFVAKAEADLAKASEYQNRVNWVQKTYVTEDTNWLVAKVNAEQTNLAVRYAQGSRPIRSRENRRRRAAQALSHQAGAATAGVVPAGARVMSLPISGRGSTRIIQRRNSSTRGKFHFGRYGGHPSYLARSE
jgi:hypothetical protein